MKPVYRQLLALLLAVVLGSALCLSLNVWDNKYTRPGAQPMDGLLTLTDEELEQEIQDAADQFEVSLTQDEILQLKELLRKLQGLDLNWDQLAKQAQGIYDKLKDMGFDLSSIDTGEFASRVSGFFGKIADFFRNLFNIE